MIELHEFQLRDLLSTAAELGAKEALRKVGMDKKQISKAEAYRIYDRWRVDRWIREGKIIPVKQKGKIFLKVADLDALSETNDLFQKHLSKSRDENRY